MCMISWTGELLGKKDSTWKPDNLYQDNAAVHSGAGCHSRIWTHPMSRLQPTTTSLDNWKSKTATSTKTNLCINVEVCKNTLTTLLHSYGCPVRGDAISEQLICFHTLMVGLWVFADNGCDVCTRTSVSTVKSFENGCSARSSSHWGNNAERPDYFTLLSFLSQVTVRITQRFCLQNDKRWAQSTEINEGTAAHWENVDI